MIYSHGIAQNIHLKYMIQILLHNICIELAEYSSQVYWSQERKNHLIEDITLPLPALAKKLNEY